jgi:LPXTG-motif cell wall-anchored protein
MTAEPAAADADAGAARLTGHIDHVAVTVGDPVVLTYTLHRPPGTEVVSFDADRALSSLTILNQVEGPPKKLPDGSVEETHTLLVAAYATGRQEVPAVKVVTKDVAGHEETVSSPPMSFDVASVLKEGETTPADLKHPIAMAENLYWPWVALGLALVAAAAYLFWRRRRRRPAEALPAVPPPLPRPEHEIAYEELQQLLSSGRLERGETKAFYIELAEILRRYLGRRFAIETFERTTFEILEALKGARLAAGAATLAAQCLGSCDLVKFAKYVPDRDETRRHVEQAYRLVDETRRRETAPAEASLGAVAAGGGTAAGASGGAA